MMKSVVRALSSTAMTALAFSGLVPCALAQTAGDAAAVAAISPGDIVVTAQKRRERLLDVPLAVTAVTSDSLARQQINDTSSLTRAVPSLQFQQGQGSQSDGFRIRGVGSQLFSLGVEASVSTVTDGVVAARATQGFADFADIERVEVLRGPQGTLFGKNATAGVVSIVTAKPTFTLTGRVETTVAEGGEYRIKGTISGPISPTVAVRISGYYNNVEGNIYNVDTRRHVNGEKASGVRGKLLWNASENLNFLLTGDYRQSAAPCCQSVLVHVVTPALATLSLPVVASPTNRDINSAYDSFNNEHQSVASLEGNWNLGAATVTSITAYQSYHNNASNVVDMIGSAAPVYTNSAIAQFYQNGGPIRLDSFSQELRIASNGDRRLTYVAGVYYDNTAINRDFLRQQALCTSGILGQPCAATYRSVYSNAENKSYSIAGFGQLEYKVVGRLKLIGGVRIQHAKTSVDGQRYSPAPQFPTDNAIPGFGPIAGYQAVSDTALTGKVGAQYNFNRDLQAYGTYTRGYKGPGFNTEPATNFATQAPVLPEYVNAYEVGLKGHAFGRILTFSGDLFLSDYTNLQVTANIGTPQVPAFTQTNAGKSITKGFEIEGNLQPSHDLSIGFGATYARSRVTANGLSCALEYQASLVAVAPGATPPANTCYGTGSGVQNIVNGHLPYAPDWRVMVSPRYEHALPGSDIVGFIQATMNYKSRQIFDISQDPLLTQKPYAIVDMSLGIHDATNRKTLTFYVRNLFNQNYYASMAHTSLLASATNAQDLTAYFNKDANRYVGGTFGLKF